MGISDVLTKGASFTLPDGRVGRVGRCRLCGAETIYAPETERDVTRPYDPDGEPHAMTCPDRDRESPYFA